VLKSSVHKRSGRLPHNANLRESQTGWRLVLTLLVIEDVNISKHLPNIHLAKTDTFTRIKLFYNCSLQYIKDGLSVDGKCQRWP